MIDLSELAGTRARLWQLCREYQRSAQTPAEKKRAQKILRDLAARQIWEEDFTFLTNWALLDRALTLAKIPLY